MIQKVSIFMVLFCFLVSFQSYGQARHDTLFYEIRPEMIEQAEVEKMGVKEPEYFIYVRLKKDYREKFEQLTGNNIGNFLAVAYEGKVISPTLPTIVAKISSGFSIGPFSKKEEAKKLIHRILKEDE